MSTELSLPSPFAFNQGRVTAIEVDSRVYSLPAILRTCYKLSDRLYSFVSPAFESPGTFVVALWTRDGHALDTDVVGMFCSDLADQELREQLSLSTATLRDLIVAQAFAEGDLLDSDSNESNDEERPGHPSIG